MVRLISLLLCAAVLVAPPSGVVAAEVVYVEDFEDENGDPAFDPMFTHHIGTNPYVSLDASLYGQLREAPNSPEHGIALGLAPAQDVISFLIPSGQEVMHATVDAQTWSAGGSDMDSIDFRDSGDTIPN